MCGGLLDFEREFPKAEPAEGVGIGNQHLSMGRIACMRRSMGLARGLGDFWPFPLPAPRTDSEAGVALKGFPDIHTLARNFNALLRIEDILHFLWTGHVHDPDAEGMAIRIPQDLREHHRPKRGECLTELRIGAKRGEPIDMDSSGHV